MDDHSITKIIFLDIDGVLNNAKLRWREGMDAIDFTCVKILGDIIQATGAKIVIHSTWRVGFSDINSLKDAFSKFLPPLIIDSIIDMTLDLPDGKAAEIREWIAENDFGGKFAVIDDDEIHIENFFRTNDNKFGLTWSIAKQIIEHLNT